MIIHNPPTVYSAGVGSQYNFYFLDVTKECCLHNSMKILKDVMNKVSICVICMLT